MHSRFLSLGALGALGCVLGWLTAQDPRPKPEPKSEPARTSLPIDTKPTGGTVGPTASESKPPKIEPVRAPKEAPNVVVVLLDDVGFGATGTFGGPIATPAGDALAKEGLRYNRFHTTALCSPTRAALLTGRNHHAVNNGVITEWATAFDGYNSVIPRSAATVAQVLQQNGYSTGCFGKWHNTPVWEVSPAGPFDRWPTALGFDEFYGFMGGEAHQYFPGLFRGTAPVERPEHAKNYHLTTDLVDQSLAWMNRQKAAAPDKPFFVYFAPGATHAPHHVAPEWVKPYEGKFDQGWDKLREETFARQLKLGVIPPDAKLTPRHESMPAWDSLDPNRKKVAAKLMEVYAGFLAHTDHEIGRLAKGIKDLGQWDNTLFIYIIGDNGAAAAGGIYGCFNEMVGLNGLQEDPAVVLKKVAEFGGPKASNEYAVGHAWAMGTPFQFAKQFASHLGGIRNPVIVTWPKRITDRGGLRSQFHHVTDVVPTIYEAAGVPAPRTVNGFTQMPIHGTSMVYTFADAKVPSARKTQYFEIMGTRGIYHDGWLASTFHNKIAWAPRKQPAFDDDRWELYHLDTDFSQGDDLAAKHPDKLKDLKELFLKEARANSVLPLDDRGPNRVVGGGRPSVVGDRTSFTLRAGAVRMPEDMIRTTFNRSYAITAALEVPKDGDAKGVVLAAGGYFGGLSLYVKEGRPHFTYNYFGSEYTTVAGRERLPAGVVTLRYEFTYAGGGLGKGGTAKLFVNGVLAAEGKIPATVPLGFSADEGLDVGEDTGTPAADYECPFRFNGKIEKVTVDLK
ncbi:MAG: arylsulfatase [Gemmata sp.]